MDGKLKLLNSFEYVPTGWTVRGSNPGGGKFFLTGPNGHCGPPSLLYNRYRVFPGGKTARV